jgi:iron-only hydrogenase maturation rSAM protein HydE
VNLSAPPPLSLLPEDTALWHRACAFREHYWGRKTFLRGIIEISNHCRQNCLYCGLRRDNAALSRYRMTPESVFAVATAAKTLGFGTVVLQAGEDPGFPASQVAALVRRIKTELNLAVTLSLGEWSRAEYQQWREAGADRYLLKLETVNETNYARLRPGKTLGQRIKALEQLAALNYETGSGLISGLPGDAPGALSQGLELLAGFRPDMLSIGPFVPHPDTPLKRCAPGSGTDNLRALAMARVAVPEAHIPVTSALGLQGDAVRLLALEVANVLMLSQTPENVRKEYAIFPGKNQDHEPPEQRAAYFRTLLDSAGFTVPPGPGSAWHCREEH